MLWCSFLVLWCRVFGCVSPLLACVMFLVETQKKTSNGGPGIYIYIHIAPRHMTFLQALNDVPPATTPPTCVARRFDPTPRNSQEERCPQLDRQDITHNIYGLVWYDCMIWIDMGIFSLQVPCKISKYR